MGLETISFTVTPSALTRLWNSFEKTNYSLVSFPNFFATLQKFGRIFILDKTIIQTVSNIKILEKFAIIVRKLGGVDEQFYRIQKGLDPIGKREFREACERLHLGMSQEEADEVFRLIVQS